MINCIVIIILLAMVMGSIHFLRKSKKKGCVGCPYAGTCQGGCTKNNKTH